MLFYKLSRGVIFRCYDQECYIWNVNQKKVYIFERTIYDILKIISNIPSCTMEGLFTGLETEYEIIAEQKYEINKLLDYLIDLNIIDEYTDLIKTEDDFDNFVIDKLLDKKQLISVVFELTYRCNEKCKHCYVDNNLREESMKQELSTEEVYKIIDQLYDANVSWITFTGGEIFCRDDAIDIIEYAVGKNFMVDIFSNGTLIDSEKILRLLKCNLRSYQSSVYGSCESVHDAITGLRGSFKKTCSVLEDMTRLGVATNMKCTIMKDNVDDYDNIVNLSNKIGCKLQVSPSIKPSLCGNTDILRCRIDDKRIKEILGKESIRVQSVNEEEKKNILSQTNICNAGYFSLTINPYGDVYICSGLGEAIGNLKKERIIDIWNYSPKLKWWQSQSIAKVECTRNCEFQEECSFCPSQAYLETGNCFKKYDEACKFAKIQTELEVSKNEGKQQEDICFT